MLNINPMSHYNKSNISFKSQKDYSKIYKQMEKITLAQEEKIIPKPSLITKVGKKNNTTSILNKKNNPLSKISNSLKKLKEYLFYEKNWVTGKMELSEAKMIWYKGTATLAAVVIAFCCIALGAVYIEENNKERSNKERSSDDWVTESVDNNQWQTIVTDNKNDTEQSFESNNLANEAFLKADSLENLYKDSTISFNDYKKQMQNVILDYNAKACVNLLEKNGITPAKEGLGNKENTYFYDENDQLIVNTQDVSLAKKLKEQATEINNNIENLNQRLRNNEEIENTSKEKKGMIVL